MGKRGPRPNPTRLRLLNGETGARINRLEPQPEIGIPDPPPEIAELAETIYRELGERLRPQNYVTLVDGAVMYGFAVATAQFRELTRMINQTGYLVRSAESGTIRNPLLIQQRQAAWLMRAFAADLGLSPAARVALKVERGTTTDERDRLFS